MFAGEKVQGIEGPENVEGLEALEEEDGVVDGVCWGGS